MGPISLEVYTKGPIIVKETLPETSNVPLMNLIQQCDYTILSSR